MSLFAAFNREIQDARARLLTIKQIRITEDSLPGSIVAVPLTPERARTFALSFEDGVEADLVTTDSLREILVHPLDWIELLEDPAVEKYANLSAPERIFAVPVVRA